MNIEKSLGKVIDETLEKYDQPEKFKKEFKNFFKNATEENLGDRDLRGLIRSVELSGDEKVET